MYYYPVEDSYFNDDQPFKLNGVRYPANWLARATPQEVFAIGLIEVVTVGTPGDPKLFYTSSSLSQGVRTIVNEPKPPEVIAAEQAMRDKREADRLALEEVRTDAKFQNLISKTPSQAKNWVDNNFPTLTVPERKDLATLVIAIGVLGRAL